MFAAYLKVRIKPITERYSDGNVTMLPLVNFQDSGKFLDLPGEVQGRLLLLQNASVEFNAVSFACDNDDGTQVNVNVSIQVHNLD